MDMTEKLMWLAFGAAIGFVLGYIVRSLREIKEELDEVDELVKRHSDERGSVNFEVLRNALLFLVLVVTVWAAFASQQSSNEVEKNQKSIDKITSCNQEYLDKTIRALNERTEYSTQQARTNVDLQRSQSRFLSLLLLQPPATDERVQEALRVYFDTLNEFVEIASRSAVKTAAYAYPTPEELSSCLNNTKKD